ncbi:hypothetical protein Fmac_018294 [Flemingia macrophylla]|uniref:S-protein homolog n=1 Tax=Flemingia macrophylla TaxID=520843 RepID=A0ABD1M4K4_9FABA
MSSFTRNVLMPLVLVGVFSSASNASQSFVNDLLVEVTNSLDGNLNLTIVCQNFRPGRFNIQPGKIQQWLYSGPISPVFPLNCNFRWPGASHYSNLYNPNLDSDCELCHWYIHQNGPCRKHVIGGKLQYRFSRWAS